MESLDCYDNRIASLRLPGNNSLVNIHCASNNLDHEMLNSIFEYLIVPGTIAIYDNPGAHTCDTSIAQNKNWTVVSD
jgi:hypothetical protein